jgi:hypothetical protein
MVETAILVACLIMALAAVFGAFPSVLDTFFGNVAKIISFPVL